MRSWGLGSTKKTLRVSALQYKTVTKEPCYPSPVLPFKMNDYYTLCIKEISLLFLSHKFFLYIKSTNEIHLG